MLFHLGNEVINCIILASSEVQSKNVPAIIFLEKFTVSVLLPKVTLSTGLCFFKNHIPWFNEYDKSLIINTVLKTYLLKAAH